MSTRRSCAIVLLVSACASSDRVSSAEPTAASATADATTILAPVSFPGVSPEKGMDVIATASGLKMVVLQPGFGTKPTKSDTVVVHYTGWRSDGNVFDSSWDRGEPAVLGVADVVRGFGEGLTRMREGEEAILWIPESLAYKGKVGSPSGLLVFQVRLLRVQ